MTTVCLDRWGIDISKFDRLIKCTFERLDSLSWETKAIVGGVGIGCMVASVIRQHDKRIAEEAREVGYEEGYRDGYDKCNEKLEVSVRNYNKLLDSMNRNKDV